MLKKRIRVVIDTNIWISYLLTNSFREFDQFIYSDKVILQFSEELLSEFLIVVKRPKFRNIISDDDIEVLLNLLQMKSEFTIVTSDLNMCSDEKDNFLLNLSVDCKADYLLTGDKDLLDLKKIKKTKIITMKEFLSLNIK